MKKNIPIQELPDQKPKSLKIEGVFKILETISDFYDTCGTMVCHHLPQALVIRVQIQEGKKLFIIFLLSIGLESVLLFWYKYATYCVSNIYHVPPH